MLVEGRGEGGRWNGTVCEGRVPFSSWILTSRHLEGKVRSGQTSVAADLSGMRTTSRSEIAQD